MGKVGHGRHRHWSQSDMTQKRQYRHALRQRRLLVRGYPQLIDSRRVSVMHFWGARWDSATLTGNDWLSIRPCRIVAIKASHGGYFVDEMQQISKGVEAGIGQVGI